MTGDDQATRPPLAPLMAPPGSPPLTILVIAFVVFIYAFFPALTIWLLVTIGVGVLPPAEPDAAQTLAFMRLKMLADALAFPLQFASVLLLLPRFTGARLEQIGLTTRRFGRNCLLGAVGAVIVYPTAFGLNCLITLWLTHSGAATTVQEHPFVQMSQNGLGGWEWAALVFTAVVSAPVMEELLFRGALQSWLEGRVWATHVVMGLAFLMSLPFKGDIGAISSQGVGALALHFAPTLLVVALSMVYAVICLRSQGMIGPAVFASSTLFAAVHSFAWPSPVALFVLALALGMLAKQTRSLVGPIVLHGLFNAISCVMLFLPIAQPQ